MAYAAEGAKMTRETLKQYDGREGRKAYTAYRGKVYDVTESPFWESGEHQGMHIAGEDLTEALAEAPHGEEVFKNFRVVAALEDAEEDPPAPNGSGNLKERLRAWYRTYHPHPATVHFPIALHLFAAALDLLFLADPAERYAVSVFYSFFAATLGGAVAMVPGTFSWWVNYHFVFSRPFAVKLILSLLTLLLGVVAIVIYLEDPAVVYGASPAAVSYHGIVLLTGLSVIVIGYYGGKLTWPNDSGRTEKAETKRVPLPDTAASAVPKPVTTPQRGPERGTGRGQSVAILIGGPAGSGIQSLESLLSDAFRAAGFYLFATKEYMSRVRGGSNTTLIRIGDVPLEAPCWEVDLFAAIDGEALGHARERCSDRTLIFADLSVAEGEAVGFPMKKTSSELGSTAYVNSYAAGVIFALLELDEAILQECIASRFADRNPEENGRSAAAGYEAGSALGRTVPAPGTHSDAVSALHLMNGTTATGFGWMAGGCNFVASYPMSPSTGVLNFMASMSRSFEVAVEQSEDEIAALNMVLGAWYAGARAATTTSGGGFALMGEAISLAGMTETPAVIYLAQRPGPATGLPTRTEQGDLDLALGSGHGDFPRLLLAPGSPKECIDYGFLAFELADRFQIPVILLADQYLADSIAMTERVDFEAYGKRRCVIPTAADYRRYEPSEDGVSPRGVPGFGEGIVVAVSDEHDARGQITEDWRVREAMVAKRLRKLEGLRSEAHPPRCIGEGTVAVVGWGSTKGAIAEALGRLGDSALFQVHFAWVHPLNPEQLEPLRRAAHVVVVENNATGQFAGQLELHGIGVTRRVLQANGFPFFADRLAKTLESVLKEIR
jgi:2-oxoglutarate ferredoxin oxidoreductase subunit alpha